MQSDLLKLLPQFDVISFDVFDTLLLRPYLKPTDLFRKVAGETFMKERIAAERAARDEARAAGREEVTYDEIYAKLPRWCDVKQRELDEERRCLTANPEIVEVYKAAKQAGKKVVIASDMYLPRAFLEEVLRGQGIDGWDAFYLSSDCGVQKATGKMFAKIVADMGVAPQRILHIGDNLYADVKAPEETGVGTWWFPKAREVFFSENPYAEKYVRHHPDAAHEDFVGALILAWQLEKCRAGYCVRQKLACLFGGAVIYAFVKWMIEDARKRGIRRFLFVARDGYTPKRLMEMLAPEFRTDYIYAPRGVSKPVQDGKPVRADYQKYVRSLDIDPAETALVDGNTEHYSSQRLINACLTEPIRGYYFIRSYQYGLSTSYFNFKYGADFNLYMFLESMYCAPTLPIRDVQNGVPVYFESQLPYEQVRADSYGAISDAILRAAEVFARNDVSIDPKALLAWLVAFVKDIPLPDDVYLTHVKNATDVSHTQYHSVLLGKKNTGGWKRICLVPVKVLSRELDGFTIVERVRVLGVVPVGLRYQFVLTGNDGLMLGDVLASIQHWVRESFLPVRGLRKIYRWARRHGEFAKR